MQIDRELAAVTTLPHSLVITIGRILLQGLYVPKKQENKLNHCNKHLNKHYPLRKVPLFFRFASFETIFS